MWNCKIQVKNKCGTIVEPTLTNIISIWSWSNVRAMLCSGAVVVQSVEDGAEIWRVGSSLSTDKTWWKMPENLQSSFEVPLSKGTNPEMLIYGPVMNWGVYPAVPSLWPWRESGEAKDKVLGLVLHHYLWCRFESPYGRGWLGLPCVHVGHPSRM